MISRPAAYQDGLPPGARSRSVLVILLGIAVSVIDVTIFNLALPGIARDLHASAADAVWVVNAYQLAALAFLLPFAAVGERIGYRTVYLGGMLTLARGVQGLGAAGIMAVNGALLRLTYSSRMPGRGIAINSAVVATASVAGPSLAALVLAYASWPWLFAPNVPLGLLVLLLGWRALPHNRISIANGTRLSWLDVALNAAMLGLFFLGAQALSERAGTASAAGTPGLALGLLGSGLVVGVVYVRRQWILRAPLFPIDLLRLPVFGLSMCTSVASFTAQTLAYVALPFLLLEAGGYSPVEAGLLITAWPVAVVATAPVAGRLIGRYADGLLCAVGLAIMAGGLALLAALPAAPTFAAIAWRLAVCGLGFGLFQSPNNHTILTSAPAPRMSAAGGMLGTARLTGQTLGAVILVFIFNVASVHDGHGPLLALVLAAGFAAEASVFSLLRLRHASAQAVASPPANPA